MANTIYQGFQKLKSNLEISGLQQATVSTRQKNVKDAVSKHITVHDAFLTGSYSRNTMIAPLKEADIDILVILDVDYFHHYDGKNGGCAGLLDFLKRKLKVTYTRTPDISRSGQAVTITFNDFIVDVVPAFHRKGGGFLIPNSITQSWLSTDPKKHVTYWSSQNSQHDGNLVPLIKMIKAWNRNIQHFFKSFHLEVMVIQILENVKITDFPSGVRYFFDKGRDYVTKKNYDPAGYGGDVGNYLSTQAKVNNAVSRFETAYKRAFNAEYFESQRTTSKAFDNWKLIFGNYFPAYGY